ncbi:MAG: UDPGP type 1 family protein [Butyribacter sp.]|nr:UDPGP type 1 family protein [bacterium]MDY3855213.1 UDPGP type 1 family protein [Butyribacter sp.]
MNYMDAKNKLKNFGQEHLLKYYDTLTKEEQDKLLLQIEETDFSMLQHIKKENATDRPSHITPITAMTLDEISEKKGHFTDIGTQAIHAGKIGAVLLAGGMGTRLGSSHPKGMYDIGLTKPVYIFQRIIENLFTVVNDTKTWIHLFIMTSEKNHADTTSFFQEHQYFGYDKDHIHFFKQNMAPATDYQGKIYLEAKEKLATSPNGNGGWFTSLNRAGLIDFMHKEGIEWLNVFSVDNVLQRIADPCFIGATIDGNYNVGAKVVRKTHPDEKVGVMCLENGHPSIIEYYELTDDLRNTTTPDGEPAYNFGVILNYLFEIKSLEQIAKKELPLHIVEKKIPYLDDDGNLVQPDEPNGYKFETLILDLIQMLDTCLPFEVIREQEFAPIKNKTGVDSIESARNLLVQNGITL